MRIAPKAGEVEIQHGVVPHDAVQDVLRLLHTDLLQEGASAPRLGEWLWAMHWFPHLRHREEVLRLADTLPERWRQGALCDPQILLQFPHVGPEPQISFHLDQEPEWAQGRRYLRIVGVPLSPWTAENGGLLVQTPEGPEPVELAPGDAVMMTPDVPHSGGINRGGTIRYGVYLRWLEDGVPG